MDINPIAMTIGIIAVSALIVLLMIYTEYQNVKIEKEIEKKRATLRETKKQVKLTYRYVDYRVLKKLLKESTVTARFIEKTDKVELRFEMIDDEGCSFIKTLEFDANSIMYDIEII